MAGQGHKLLRGNEAHVYTRWETLPLWARSEATRWVYIGPDGSWWDLAGPRAGRQGVQFAQEMQGAYHLPFEHLLTESAYQIGASYERTNILKRIINTGVMIGSQTRPLTMHQYRTVESKWWDAWPIGIPGWLGCHTKTGGWRWIKVMQASSSTTSMRKDPAYADNATMTWEFKMLAVDPWYAKRALIETFVAHPQTVADKDWDEETITICNRGNMPAWPKFVYSGPGFATVQDGMTDRMVRLPTLSAADGEGMVDTDEGARTLTGATDPVDNEFYKLARKSGILKFVLHDVGDLGLPLWRRAKGIRFLSMIPPRTVANIKVRHSRPGGSVTVIVPQWFTRPS